MVRIDNTSIINSLYRIHSRMNKLSIDAHSGMPSIGPDLDGKTAVYSTNLQSNLQAYERDNQLIQTLRHNSQLATPVIKPITNITPLAPFTTPINEMEMQPMARTMSFTAFSVASPPPLTTTFGEVDHSSVPGVRELHAAMDFLKNTPLPDGGVEKNNFINQFATLIEQYEAAVDPKFSFRNRTSFNPRNSNDYFPAILPVMSDLLKKLDLEIAKATHASYLDTLSTTQLLEAMNDLFKPFVEDPSYIAYNSEAYKQNGTFLMDAYYRKMNAGTAPDLSKSIYNLSFYGWDSEFFRKQDYAIRMHLGIRKVLEELNPPPDYSHIAGMTDLIALKRFATNHIGKINYTLTDLEVSSFSLHYQTYENTVRVNYDASFSIPASALSASKFIEGTLPNDANRLVFVNAIDDLMERLIALHAPPVEEPTLPDDDNPSPGTDPSTPGGTNPSPGTDPATPGSGGSGIPSLAELNNRLLSIKERYNNNQIQTHKTELQRLQSTAEAETASEIAKLQLLEQTNLWLLENNNNRKAKLSFLLQ